jgi:hypothetical protein
MMVFTLEQKYFMVESYFRNGTQIDRYLSRYSFITEIFGRIPAGI